MPAMPAWLVALLLLAALVLFILAALSRFTTRYNLVAAGLACWMLTLAWAAFTRL
jgi:hypothetical protein